MAVTYNNNQKATSILLNKQFFLVNQYVFLVLIR